MADDGDGNDGGRLARVRIFRGRPRKGMRVRENLEALNEGVRGRNRSWDK